MAVKHRSFSRHQIRNGQLAPLGERMSEIHQVRREERMSRRAVRSFAIELGTIRGGLAQFFGRGFFGRLKWMVTGR